MCREPEAVHGQAVYAYKEPLWSRAAAIESWAVRLKVIQNVGTASASTRIIVE